MYLIPCLSVHIRACLQIFRKVKLFKCLGSMLKSIVTLRNKKDLQTVS